MVSRMYTLQIARSDRMYKFVIQDERFKSLEGSLKVDIAELSSLDFKRRLRPL
jgi:hypothetical protein